LSQFSVGGNDRPIVFVNNKWLHLGHIIITMCDDKAGIIGKLNVVCGQINNVTMYCAFFG